MFNGLPLLITNIVIPANGTKELYVKHQLDWITEMGSNLVIEI